ncbi:protein of unknown function [Bowdeniella nasicola]|uniref:HNH domain-containing protein n=1 Tax=Bowdeniella nasicola TaxID=208480 RepID=A0A1H3XUA6_9ACTO|nr:HNH endonuclease signature motif containing protein [Bowdeniella nasicola]SEA03035.1 protein of unknown function [Bowdeniella nasicola]
MSHGALTEAELDVLRSLHARASQHGVIAKNRDEAVEALKTLEAVTAHLSVTVTRLIAQVDRSRRGQRGRTTSAIISEVRKLPTKLADSIVKKSRRHANHPEVLTAQATGRISEPNAATICQTLEELRPFLTDDATAEATRVLLNDAEFSMPAAFKRRCRAFKDEIDLQGARTRAEQDDAIRKASEAKRFLVFIGDNVNGYDIRGHLPGRHAAAVMRWLDRESNRLLRKARARRQPVAGEATRTLDALVSLASAAPARAAPPSPAPANSAPMDSNTASASPAPTNSAIAEDPTARLMGPSLRHRLTARDGGCVVPWCHVRAELCDGHHIVKWSDGGPTTAENMCLLCTRHHPEFENTFDDDTGWCIKLIDGIPAAIPPSRIDPQRRPRFHERFRPKIPPPKASA